MSQTTVVMTGEGAKGSFQAGVLLRLMSEGLRPDKYVGISSGALNAFLFSQIEPEAIVDLIRSLKSNRDLFKLNAFTLLFAEGIYNSKPLAKKLGKVLKNARLPKDKRSLAVVSDCNASTGQIRYTEISKLSDEQMIDRVLSAVSIAGYVAPAIKGYIDAGAVEINPLEWELRNGEPGRKICIFARPLTPTPTEPPSGFLKFVKYAYRSMDLSMHAHSVNDIEYARENKDPSRPVTVITPHVKLYEALDFAKSEQGYQKGLIGAFKTIEI